MSLIAKGKIHDITINVIPTSGPIAPLLVAISGVVTNQFGQPMQRPLRVLINGKQKGITNSDSDGEYSVNAILHVQDFDVTGTAHVAIQALDGVSSRSVPVIIGSSSGSPTDSITISPSGSVSLVEAASASSVTQVVTGVAKKQGVPVSKVPLYSFVNGMQVPGTVVTDGAGNYSTTIVFQPLSFPAVFLVNVSDNILNN